MSRRARGIRTAARKKKGRSPRRLIGTAIVNETARAIRRLFPKATHLYLVGSRLRHRYGRDIEFVVEMRNERDLPGRNLQLRVGALQVDLFFAFPDEVESTILEFGLGLDNIRWKREAKRRGLHLNRYGLWKGKTFITSHMDDIAHLLGKPLKPHLVWSLENPL